MNMKLSSSCLWIIIILSLLFIVSQVSTNSPFSGKGNLKIKNAICVLTNTTIDSIEGTIKLSEQDNGSLIDINIKGLPPGLHGFHIHNKGNLTDGCKSLCSHFNPFDKNHGGPDSKEHHVGDLGNIFADQYGNVNIQIFGNDIYLNGPLSVLGRSFVIHSGEDDLGLGTGVKRAESLKTGNAGHRIACGVIGIA